MPNNNPIILCPPVKMPTFICMPSKNFGVPKGSHGRHGQVIKGIVIHCVEETIEEYDTLACQDLKLKGVRNAHPSLHYYVSSKGFIRQYVDEGDVAWGFPSQLQSAIPSFSTFNWPLVFANPGVPIDYYTLQIGVDKRLWNDMNVCKTCEGVQDVEAFKQLVRLIAFLREKYSIILDIDHIAAHQNIDALAEGECGDCFDMDKIICAVSDYCERVDNPADPTLKEADDDETSLYKVYGEDKYGERRWSILENFALMKIDISIPATQPIAGVMGKPVIVKVGTSVFMRDVLGEVIQIV